MSLTTAESRRFDHAQGSELTAREKRGSLPRLGCIADDYTGAADVATSLRNAGLRTLLFFGPPPQESELLECDAIVIALKIRSVPSEEAAQGAVDAFAWLSGQQMTRLYFKYCSTFDSTDDGNIGVIADTLMALSGATFTVVCPSLPTHGRTVYLGHLFVGSQLLAHSAMRDHPLNPMRESDLLHLLRRQTRETVELLPLHTVRAGVDATRDALRSMAKDGVRYAVADATEDQDLQVLAAAADDLPMLTGSAGLARFVAKASPETALHSPPQNQSMPAGPVLVLAGSCSDVTLEQISHARRVMVSHRLDVNRPFDESALVETASAWIENHLPNESAVLVYSSVPQQLRGQCSGNDEDSKTRSILERTFGALAAHAVQLGVRRIVVAGGETSGAVIDALRINSVIVGQEEDPGVPWLFARDDPKLALLLKSGNFGSPDLFVRVATWER